MKRHIRDCTNFTKGSCKFQNSCAYKHDSNKIIKESENETISEKLNDDSDYIDYDNLNSDDDEIDENTKNVETTFSCDQCDYTSNVKSSLTKHVKTSHENSCEQCDFTTTNKMHLNMHVRACHKKNLHTKANITKNLHNKTNITQKRKSTDEIVSSSSGKRKKRNVISKKVKRVC